MEKGVVDSSLQILVHYLNKHVSMFTLEVAPPNSLIH